MKPKGLEWNIKMELQAQRICNRKRNQDRLMTWLKSNQENIGFQKHYIHAKLKGAVKHSLTTSLLSILKVYMVTIDPFHALKKDVSGNLKKNKKGKVT